MLPSLPVSAIAPSSAYRRLKIPDAERYWVEQVKCRVGCPVFTDACGYVTAVAEGRDEDAYRIARATNPFVSVCGRICGAPCEAACRRGSVDTPVSIRAVKRWACELYGNETGTDEYYHRFADSRMLIPKGVYTEKVAVVGAGVAGLTVAHDLARAGYRVTVFEAGPVAGGMLTTGVPLYRLPRELVKAEIDAILALGIELRLNTRVGPPDRTLAQLRAEGYQAFFLGTGLQASRRLDLPGSSLPGVLNGIDFLKLVNLGQSVEIGPRVLVIGGGNVAFDVARTAVRRSTDEEAEDFRVSADVARTAMRRKGVTEVHLACLESRAEMPADSVEIEEGQHEGIRVHTQMGPRSFVGNERVTGVEFAHCLSVFDSERRFSPKFDESLRETLECDTVILAVGQRADLNFLGPEDQVELTDRGLVKVDSETLQTSRPDVFAGGDIVLGPRLFIDAVATGQTAARSIHDYLRGTTTRVTLHGAWEPAVYTMAPDWEVRRRQLPPSDAPRPEEILERPDAAGRQVERNYPEAEARRQAERCLRCDVQTAFEGSLCIACNGCVDVCPDDCLHLVGLSQVAQDPKLLTLAQGQLGIEADQLKAFEPWELDALGGVMLKDETACIRCSMCATRCPTHAFTMQRYRFHRQLEILAGPNPRLRGTKGGAGS